ncbi:MAG: hypothetical protein H0V36_07735 [Chloroflexi bacterium]|nr:hypothetical protein [Chloroflexota bacterium]
MTLLVSVGVQAHPLGNFTFNTYDGLLITPTRVVVDHVRDIAEIPAFQERQGMDADGDGNVDAAEGAEYARRTCPAVSDKISLILDGAVHDLTLTALGISFPPGQAGLVTLRLVCVFQADRAVAATGGSSMLEFRDDDLADRPGWREIVADGSGVALSGAEAWRIDVSDRLRNYPPELIARPLGQRSATFGLSVDGSPAQIPDVPDAVPVGSPDGSILGAGTSNASVPGGIADLPPEITSAIQARDLSVPSLILAFAVAIGLGAFHAATPGHGKTLMAAYLVGTRGTIRHALGLGLTVTVSHTIGVLALGALIVGAGAVVAPEVLFPVLGAVSGLIVIAIGVVIVTDRWREGRRRQGLHASSGLADDLTHEHHDASHEHAHDEEHGHDHEHPHDHEHEHSHGLVHERADPGTVGGWHSHGLVRHTHLPQGENPLSWRNLFALGLVGGLVPSASAIVILVGTIALGRPVLGMALTIAFGTGMAAVLVGVGILLVRARGFVERWPRSQKLAPLMSHLPLVTAVIFLVVGSVIAVQSVLQLSALR